MNVKANYYNKFYKHFDRFVFLVSVNDSIKGYVDFVTQITTMLHKCETFNAVREVISIYNVPKLLISIRNLILQNDSNSSNDERNTLAPGIVELLPVPQITSNSDRGSLCRLPINTSYAQRVIIEVNKILYKI